LGRTLNSPRRIVQQEVKGAVGIVSASHAGLLEVVSLLARDGVPASQTIAVAGDDLSPQGGGEAMLAGLRTLQADAATEVIVLLSGLPSTTAADQVLTQVRASDKPTVVCFLGSDQRLIWRAGAIPAARLDEAAMRAAAWVRGWDQALVSSRLKDFDEQWAALAADLRAEIGPGRDQLRGVFTGGLLCQEAQRMLAEVSGGQVQATFLDLSVGRPSLACPAARFDPAAQLRALREAWTDPHVALILLDVVLGHPALPDPAGALAGVLAEVPRREERDEPLIIARVCGQDPRQVADQEARLCAAGMVVMLSNAAAARLAGMILAQRSASSLRPGR